MDGNDCGCRTDNACSAKSAATGFTEVRQKSVSRKEGSKLKSRVVIKSSKSGMSIILDPDCTFEDLLSDLAAKFRENARFWGSVQMALILEGRELTAGEEFQIVA